MNTSSLSIRWTAWFRWFGVTLLGLVAGLVVFIVVGSLLGEAGEEAPPIVFGLVLGTIFGSAFGIAHWLFLRRYLSGVAAWMPATVVALALAAAIIFGLLNPADSEASVPLRIGHATLAGLSLGFAQWLVLRATPIHRAHLWILFSLVSWIVGELTSIALENLQVESPLPFMAMFLVAASLPGFGLIWLLKQRFQARVTQGHTATV